MRYGEMEKIEVVSPHRPVTIWERSMPSMTGHPKNSPVIPAQEEPFEIIRKRELLFDLTFYDGGIIALTDTICASRMEHGYYVQSGLSTSVVTLKLRTLLRAMAELSRLHSATLAALAAL